MYIAMGLGSGISVLAFWCPQNVPAAVGIIGLLAYGITSGAWITLVAAACGAISPTREFGMRLGMLWSLSSLGTLAGPVICGGKSASLQWPQSRNLTSDRSTGDGG
jgi:MCP family monocarboxylic acid transporter-like MFS transporter 10